MKNDNHLPVVCRGKYVMPKFKNLKKRADFVGLAAEESNCDPIENPCMYHNIRAIFDQSNMFTQLFFGKLHRRGGNGTNVIKALQLPQQILSADHKIIIWDKSFLK